MPEDDWVDLELEQGTWIKIAQMAERENITMAHAVERLTYTVMLKKQGDDEDEWEFDQDFIAAQTEALESRNIEIMNLRLVVEKRTDKIDRLKAKVRGLKEDLEIAIDTYREALAARDEVIRILRAELDGPRTSQEEFGTYLP